MHKRPDLSLRNKTDNPAWRPEVKAKISASRKGKPTTLGIPCSPEKKLKISLALKGKPTGRRPSPEVIIKFIEAGKKYRKTFPKGNLHPNWKGGISPARQKEYGNPQYLAFVSGVLTRDNYTCQDCGVKNGNGYNVKLEAHHKISYAERLDLRYDIDNGITLCFYCHKQRHGNNKRPKTIDFVKKKRICQICKIQFEIFNPRKYCPECKIKYCCPICGSTNCRHKERKLYCSMLP